MYSVCQSSSPQFTLPTFSGTWMTPSWSPSGAKIHTPPGPVTYTVAAFVELHPVHELAAREVAPADPVGEHAAARERVIRPTSKTRMWACTVSLM